MPVVASLVIVAWQYSFTRALADPNEPYRMRASVGLCEDAHLFFYFFYHFGLFPVGSTDVPRLGPSEREAIEYVQTNGKRLQMDFGTTTNTPRFGDYGKLFLFFPDVWLRHDPAHPSVGPFNQCMFIAALLAVVWSFWFEGRALLGLLIAVLVGSDPFQLFETWTRGNIFSIPISTTLLALSVHLRFLTGRKGVERWSWPIAILSGIALATLRDVRLEASIIAVSVAATYLLVRSAPVARRLLLLASFVAAMVVTGAFWHSYWNHKFDEATKMVERAGGQVFRGQRDTHHALWHAVYCGLGDYGADRGYGWADDLPIHWATTYDPVTNPKPLPYHYDGGPYLRETWDGVHRIAPTDLPEYNRLVRDRVLTEILHHPGWYAWILCRRLFAIIDDATPASLSVGPLHIQILWAGWLLVPGLALLLWRRRFFETKLVLFTLPLSLVAFVVYSGKGMTYYGIAHLIVVAIGIDLLVRSLPRAFAALRARGAAVPRGGAHAG